MPGLLGALDDVFAGSSITVSVDAQLGPLGDVSAAVQLLVDGPDAVAGLEAAVEALPLPPGLEGLAAVPPALASIGGGFDLDLAAPLAPLLAPLEGVAAGAIDLGAVTRITGAVDCVRLVIDLISGRTSGPSGLPLPPELWRRQGFVPDVTPEDLRERVADFRDLIGEAGPRLDGAAIVALLRRIAPYWRSQMNEWPAIPVISDVMEVAGVAVEWAALEGPQLTAHLDTQLRTLARVVALPRSRVADPLAAQARTAARLPEVLANAQRDLVPLLNGLRHKVAVAHAKPTPTELGLLEAQVRELEAVAAAVGLDGTPLGDLDDLVPQLELHLLRAVRAVIPPYGPTGIAAAVDDLLAAIPEAEPDPLGDAVAAIAALDVSVLAGPIGAVREAVEDAVAAVTGALDTVRDEVTSLLAPAADALDDLLASSGIADLQQELAGLPGAIEGFVDDEVRPALEPITTGVADAVAAVDAAADQFDPEAMIAPLRDAIDDVAAVVGTGEVTAVVQEVEAAIQAAVDVLSSLDFAVAADATIDLLAGIEAQLAEIDLSDVPEALHAPLAAAVEVVASIDFTAEVGGPLTADVTAALAAGPAEVLNQLQGHMDELKENLERFRPSVAIGAAVDEPFAAVLDQLDGFQPSDLLSRLDDALASAAARVNVLDPDAILAPLSAAHGEVAAAIEAIRPSNLLAPVDEAIAAAVAAVFEATGADDVFDGIDDVVGELTAFVDLVAEARGALDAVADLLSEPGDVAAALDALVTELADQLDDVDLAALRPRFDEVAAASSSVERGAIAADLVDALRSAQRLVPAALAGTALHEITEQVGAFPVAQLAASRPVPRRKRLVDLLGRLGAALATLGSAPEPWAELVPEIDARAPRLEADLATYARLSVIDGRHVFADCIVAPASVAELKASVRAAARDSLELPVTALFGLFARLAPHVAGVAAGLGDMVGAVHAKLDAVVGAEGIAGVAAGLEEVADLLRNLDLSPLTGPLDALVGRVEAAVAALDPAQLAPALRAAADAIAGLLDLSSLVDPATTATLDAAYDAAVGKLRALSPGAVVAATLDPVYDDLLGGIVPLLELPGRLAELLASVGTGLTAEVTAQLARVEAAFDAMLRAIPFDGAGGGISVSVEASVSVGAG